MNQSKQEKTDMRCSPIITFTETGKLSDANYRATSPHWGNNATMTQNKALVGYVINNCVCKVAKRNVRSSYLPFNNV